MRENRAECPKASQTATNWPRHPFSLIFCVAPATASANLARSISDWKIL